MTADDLTAALRACAAGLYPLEAGTALLIANETFLRRVTSPAASSSTAPASATVPP
jgi:hypothetical protein